MPEFSNHVEQAKRNLNFLEQINKSIPNNWDWQVTVGFYAGVHLINGHIAKKENKHYQSHERVDQAINLYSACPAKLPQDIYLAYQKLQNLSKRARYLCHDDPAQKGKTQKFTYLTSETHFVKSLMQLEKIITYFEKEYDETLPSIELNCGALQSLQLSHFKYFSLSIVEPSQITVAANS